MLTRITRRSCIRKASLIERRKRKEEETKGWKGSYLWAGVTFWTNAYRWGIGIANVASWMYSTLYETISGVDMVHDCSYWFWGGLSSHSVWCVVHFPDTRLLCMSHLPEFWPHLNYTLGVHLYIHSAIEKTCTLASLYHHLPVSLYVHLKFGSVFWGAWAASQVPKQRAYSA